MKKNLNSEGIGPIGALFIVFLMVFVYLVIKNTFKKSDQDQVKKGSKTIVLDHCQYIIYNNAITHKGNCINPIHYE